MNSFALGFASLLAVTASSQDLIAVNWDGEAYAVDSRDGSSRLIGPTGRYSHNAMARVGTELWITSSGSHVGQPFALDVLDEATGVASRRWGAPDLRALAGHPQLGLLAVVLDGGRLARIDPSTGVLTHIGSLGYTRVQALTMHGGICYAWDVVHGLLRVNLSTGAATDVDPFVPGGDLQFLMSHSDGRLLGGRKALYEIDPATGTPRLIGSGGYSDLRGAEERFGVAYAFGQGCGGITHAARGTPRAGFSVTTTASGHTPYDLGFLILGGSNSSYLGVPLPIDLDPFLGTVGCRLLVSLDVTLPWRVAANGTLTFPLDIPASMAGVVFHVQHAEDAPSAPGQLVVSNGVTIRVAL